MANCKTCGRYSGFYPLCKKCYALRDKSEELIKTNESCTCINTSNKVATTVINDADYKSQVNTLLNRLNITENLLSDALTSGKKLKLLADKCQSRCIICNEQTQGNAFCSLHYDEYKDSTILLRVTNCDKFEIDPILNHKGKAASYKCSDGHIVKSKSELAIDNYLFNNGISHAYEKAYPIDDNPKHTLYPDFYLPTLDLYIEHWGYKNKKDYDMQKERKINIYTKDELTVISTYEEDMTDIESALSGKLKHFTKNIVNF